MRKTAIVQIQDDNRDRGKVFHLTEMDAVKAERWAMRALQALARSGAEVPEEMLSGGFASVGHYGLRVLANMPFGELTLLMDEMMECVKIQPDAQRPDVVRMLMLDDIEEVTTRLKLRMEVFDLHTGFSKAGGQSTPPSSPANDPADSSTTQTSPLRLARS